VTSVPSPEPGPLGFPEATGERVDLAFPLRPDLRYLARMTAAAVAAKADFGIDQVEDLRLAIDELCITVAGEEGGAGRLHLSFEWEAQSLTVIATAVPDGVGPAELSTPSGSTPAAAPAPSDLSARILDALVDEHGTDSVGGAARAWMVLRRRDRS